MRFEETTVCKDCREYKLNCDDGKKCQPIKTKLRKFSGIRHTADGFDCALPITIDSHSSCAYECLYCFSDNILGHKNMAKPVGQTSLSKLVNQGAGPTVLYNVNHKVWADNLRETWNDMGKERSPMNYFQGALQPAGIDENNNRIYKYVGLERKYLRSQWQIAEK